MASIVNRHGLQCEAPRPIVVNGEVVSRTRDTIIVRLRKQGLSFTAIGAVMNITKQAARQRYHSLPDGVRSYYASVPVG